MSQWRSVLESPNLAKRVIASRRGYGPWLERVEFAGDALLLRRGNRTQILPVATGENVIIDSAIPSGLAHLRQVLLGGNPID